MPNQHGQVTKEDILQTAKELDLEVLEGEEIAPGDLYLAGRNTGVKLLTCAKNVKEKNFIVPTEMEYCYDTWECYKVKEK